MIMKTATCAKCGAQTMIKPVRVNRVYAKAYHHEQHQCEQCSLIKDIGEARVCANQADRDALLTRALHTAHRVADSHESLLAACQRALAIEQSVTQGLERELRDGFVDSLRAAIAKATQP